MSRGIGVGSLVIAGAAFAVGLVLGGLGPRAELRQVQDELFEMRRKGLSKGTARNEFVELVAKGFNQAPTPAAPESEAAFEAEPPPSAPIGRPVVTVNGKPVGDAPEALGEDWRPEDSIGAAKEMMELRRTQARAALFEDVDPTPEQEASIDAVLDDMNRRLVTLSEDIVDEMKAGPDASRRVFMEFAAEGLDIALQAEDGLLDSLSPEQADRLTEEMTDPSSFIDPAVVDVLAELEGLLPQ